MNSFVVGTFAAVILAVIAAVAMQSLGLDTASVFSSPNVRL